jgi:hypothetical protein
VTFANSTPNESSGYAETSAPAAAVAVVHRLAILEPAKKNERSKLAYLVFHFACFSNGASNSRIIYTQSPLRPCAKSGHSVYVVIAVFTKIAILERHVF